MSTAVISRPTTKKGNVTLVGTTEELPLSPKELERVKTLMGTEPTIHSYPWGQLRKVAEKCFSVTKEAMPAPVSPNAIFDAPNNTYGVYKTTGGKCLGIVGAGYEVIEPLQFLKIIHIAFIQARKESLLKRIRFNEMFDGEVFGFQVPLKEFTVKSKLKVGDVTEMFLDFRTGLNGIVPSTLSINTKRLWCDNGATSVEKGAQHKFKHLTNKNKEVLKYALSLIKSINVADRHIEVMEAFAKKEMKSAEINELFEQITGYNVEKFTSKDENVRKDLHHTQIASFEKMWGAMQLELKECGNTAFGFLNGITQYTNHVAPLLDMPKEIDKVKASPKEIESYNQRVAEVKAHNKLMGSRTAKGSKARAEVYEFNKNLKELVETTVKTLKTHCDIKEVETVEA